MRREGFPVEQNERYPIAPPRRLIAGGITLLLGAMVACGGGSSGTPPADLSTGLAPGETCVAAGECGDRPCCQWVGQFVPWTDGPAHCGSSPSDCATRVSIEAAQLATRLCRSDDDCTRGTGDSRLRFCCSAPACERGANCQPVDGGVRIHFCSTNPYLPIDGGVVTCP